MFLTCLNKETIIIIIIIIIRTVTQIQLHSFGTKLTPECLDSVIFIILVIFLIFPKILSLEDNIEQDRQVSLYLTQHFC